MQQRRLRLGDIVDDYCPRERRVTNHAIVAMVEDDIKQVRCTTCDTEHEYKRGKMPTLRRKKEAIAAAYNEVLAAVQAEAPVPAAPSPVAQVLEAARAGGPAEATHPMPPTSPPGPVPIEAAGNQAPQDPEDGDVEGDDTPEGRVHRRLIRATLPRPENHQVVRPVPEFTMRQPTGRPGKFRGGMARAAGARPGAVRGGNIGGNSRAPVFGRTAGGRGGGQAARPGGRNDGHRPVRGAGHPSRPGKKQPK
jgi:hypothetical protein